MDLRAWGEVHRHSVLLSRNQKSEPNQPCYWTHQPEWWRNRTTDTKGWSTPLFERAGETHSAHEHRQNQSSRPQRDDRWLPKVHHWIGQNSSLQESLLRFLSRTMDAVYWDGARGLPGESWTLQSLPWRYNWSRRMKQQRHLVSL